MEMRAFFLIGILVLAPFANPLSAGERMAERCSFTGTLGACTTSGAVSAMCLHQEDYDHELQIQCTGDMVATCDAFFGEPVRLQATLYLFAINVLFEATRVVAYAGSGPDQNRCHLEGELNELVTPDVDVEQFYHLYKIEAHRNLDVFCPEGVNGTECIPCIDEQVELNSFVIMDGLDPIFTVTELDC